MSPFVDDWKVHDVSTWLIQIGLCKYVETFVKHDIDGEVLLTMTENDLTSAPMNLSTFGEIRKFGVAMEKLKTENASRRRRDEIRENPSATSALSKCETSAFDNKPASIDLRSKLGQDATGDVIYENDIEAALNGAAFVGGYDEPPDDVNYFTDDDDDDGGDNRGRDGDGGRDEMRTPFLDEETEMQITKWIRAVNVVHQQRQNQRRGRCDSIDSVDFATAGVLINNRANPNMNPFFVDSKFANRNMPPDGAAGVDNDYPVDPSGSRPPFSRSTLNLR